MDYNTIIESISVVGFPIVMCLILLWYCYTSDKRHSAEIDKLNETLNNNTIALTKLCERLER